MSQCKTHKGRRTSSWKKNHTRKVLKEKLSMRKHNPTNLSCRSVKCEELILSLVHRYNILMMTENMKHQLLLCQYSAICTFRSLILNAPHSSVWLLESQPDISLLATTGISPRAKNKTFCPTLSSCSPGNNPKSALFLGHHKSVARIKTRNIVKCFWYLLYY